MDVEVSAPFLENVDQLVSPQLHAPMANDVDEVFTFRTHHPLILVSSDHCYKLLEVKLQGHHFGYFVKETLPDIPMNVVSCATLDSIKLFRSCLKRIVRHLLNPIN